MTLTLGSTFLIGRNANDPMHITDDEIILIVENGIVDFVQLGNRRITTDSARDVIHIDIVKMNLLIRVNQKKVRTNETQRSTIRELLFKSLTRSILIVKHLDPIVATIVDKSEQTNRDDRRE
jgi:hypothetical protein